MLTDRMKWKLRQLTFISLCARQRIIPLKLAMDELHLPRIEDFEKFYISCIEDGIIKVFRTILLYLQFNLHLLQSFSFHL